MSARPRKLIWSLLLLAVASQFTAALAEPLACDDGIKQAFRPDENTNVVAVRMVKKGEELLAPDAPTPITAAADLCLVKLLVGPGVTAEKDKSARSYSEGIGIEVWLPTPANWNERIRNYGGGGWVGGGHRYADKIGSKVPAIVNANVGYASGTTDAGQPWYQDGSFTFLSDGKVNAEALRSFSVGAMVEQAVKTRALVNLYYGKAPKFAYYDGHSQGGRQGMKIAQDFPELYDGYLIAQPALNIARFGTASIYPQIVMKTELGITAINKDQAAAFAAKVDAANKRAVAACDKAGLGFLLDPFACDYDPARDAAALCAGEAGIGVTGSSNDAATCMSASEARALGKIWYGATSDGSVDTAQTRDARSGKSLGNNQLWWTFTRGTAITSLIKSASTDSLALALQDVSYAADASATLSIPIANGSTNVRNKWLELDYAGVADAVDKNVSLQPTLFAGLATDKADLAKLRDLGRKVIVWSGLADDAIPPAGNVNYHERVVATMGGHAEVQKFLRMYLLPGVAHSSQGRAFAAAGRNDAVPLPKLPGNSNQKPAREQDQFFSALTDWVEQGVAPEEIMLVSRDNTVSYPACVYPLMTTWNGSGPATQPSSFSCR
ncbi:tannase/feruloyl esterase family alpha/beta hydrolase [Bradyrhizobium yuanmingense]|uniref:tannase/feruloyl esterase family alpha/beta hydrolase n=1 Tax=Bradyrhizobium yuanmingense TaxID=108015 RepID=UPI0012FB78D1|nr:tannase/feruloyl esterase family alpha/beta hydrolase [Bradyrhizobium yuanmingense]